MYEDSWLETSSVLACWLKLRSLSGWLTTPHCATATASRWSTDEGASALGPCSQPSLIGFSQVQIEQPAMRPGS